jgi:8-oxo-dGTP diphosphatase
MSKESFPGLLDISAAGHVSAGETPIQAALRELEEELNIKADAKELKEIWASRVSVDPKPGYHNRHVYRVYLLKHDALPQTLQKDEVESVEFIPLDKFEKEVNDPELSKKYVQRDYYPMLIRTVREALGGVQGL